MELFTTSCTAADTATIDLPEELDSPQTLVLLFAGINDVVARDALKAVDTRFPLSVVTGCSTAGEIIGTEVKDEVVAIAIVKFARTKLRMVSIAAPDPATSYTTGHNLARELDGPDLAGVFVLSDGISVNGATLMKGMNSILGAEVKVTGGLAGDGDRWKTTWVIANGESKSNWTTGVGFYGTNISIGHGCFGGWDAFGPSRVVTKSEGAELIELDGHPALPLYKDYLGELADGLPTAGLRFPLAIRENADDQDFVMRTVVDVDQSRQSLRFAGDIPEGWFAQLMSGNLERLIDGAARSARQASSTATLAGQTLGIAVSCVGRRAVLRDRIEEELEAAIDVLGTDTQLFGFYSYGEISPHMTGPAEFHNQTMTLTIISET